MFVAFHCCFIFFVAVNYFLYIHSLLNFIQTFMNCLKSIFYYFTNVATIKKFKNKFNQLIKNEGTPKN